MTKPVFNFDDALKSLQVGKPLSGKDGILKPLLSNKQWGQNGVRGNWVFIFLFQCLTLFPVFPVAINLEEIIE